MHVSDFEKGQSVESAINNLSEVEKEIRIKVTAGELHPHFEKAYRRFQPKLQLKGFRKGKVPLDIVKKMYAEQIEYDSLDVIATEIYRDIAKEKSIQPVGEPVLTDIDYKRGDSLEFKVKYEILPEIDVKGYKGITVEKPIHAVTEKEIEDEILRIRRSNATTEEAQSVDSDEYVVTADVQELDDTGFPIIGKRSEHQRYYLGDENLDPEFRSALRSATTGSPVRIKYESRHGDHTHPINVQATATKIEKVILPDVTDEFVKKVTKEKTGTVSEFMQNLRNDIENYWKDRTERRLADAIASEIIRKHDFAVPETLVISIINRQIEDLKTRFPKKQLPADFDENKYREEMRPSAIWQAKWFLIRERIIEKEGIDVDEAALANLAEEKSKQTGIEKEKLLEFFKNSEETRRQLLSDKLITFLKSKAKITEKVTEEFF